MALYCKGEQVTPTSAGIFRRSPLSQPKGDPAPLTIMYSVYEVEARAALYTTFFTWGPDVFGGGHYLVTFRSPVNLLDEYAMGFDGNDTFTGVGPITGRWLTHAMRTRQVTSGSDHPTDFFWDLPRLTAKISGTRMNNIVVQATQQIMLAGTPWALSEGANAWFAGLKIWQAWLPDGALLREATSIYPVLEQYRASLWCAIPCDTRQTTTGLIIRDVSGHGRHFNVYDGVNAVTTVAGPPRIPARRSPAGLYLYDAAPAGAADTTLAASLSLSISSASALTTQIQMASAPTLSLSLAAALTTEIRMASAVSLSISAAGTLTTSISMASVVTLSLSSSAAFSTSITMASSVSLSISATASLTTSITMEASGSLTISTTADLTVGNTVASSVTLSLSASASLSTEITMSATRTLSISTSAALTTSITMAATAALSLSTSADLSTQMAMAATGNVTLSASANLTTAITMASSTTLSLNAAAALTTSIQMAAAMTLSITCTAELTFGIGSITGTILTVTSAVNIGQLASSVSMAQLSALAQMPVFGRPRRDL